ncbi:MAG: dihydrodipicolinate synthase family protein [Candidatus Bathyarchaeia archaeon]
MRTKFQGFIPALPTPVRPDESIDKDGVRRLIDYVFQKGADGVFILGYMGEFAKIVDAEKERLIRISRDFVKSNKHFLVGVSDTGTKRVISNARKAQDLGADAVVALPPYFYNLKDQDIIHSFFVEVAESIDLPLFIYANSSSTRVKIALETVERLSRHKNIVGIKYTEPEVEDFTKLLSKVKNREFCVFYGNEKMFDLASLAGADGLIGGVTCLIPDVVKEIHEAGLSGDKIRAAEGQKKINRLMDFISDSWIHSTKYALKILGICDDYVCKPYVPMTLETKTLVEIVLKELGLI